jgi:hypothetical protein
LVKTITTIIGKYYKKYPTALLFDTDISLTNDENRSSSFLAELFQLYELVVGNFELELGLLIVFAELVSSNEFAQSADQSLFSLFILAFVVVLALSVLALLLVVVSNGTNESI